MQIVGQVADRLPDIVARLGYLTSLLPSQRHVAAQRDLRRATMPRPAGGIVNSDIMIAMELKRDKPLSIQMSLKYGIS
jgi:hypothetical protein